MNESIVLRSIADLFGWLRNSYRFSLLARILHAVFSRLAVWFAASGILKFLWRDGYLARRWPQSLAYRALDGLVHFPSWLLNKGYSRFEEAFHQSLVHRGMTFLCERVHILTALFLLVVLAVPHNRWDNKYSTLAVAGLLFLFFYRTVIDRGVRFRIKAMDIFLILFLVALVLAQVLSVDPSLSSRTFIFYLTDLFLVLLLVSSIRDENQLRQVLDIVLVGLTLSGLYGVYQGIKGVPVIASQIDVEVNDGMPGRIFSTLENPNNFAEVLTMLLPFYFSTIANSKGIFRKMFFSLMAVPPLISLALTLSRSSWIGFAIAVLVILFFKNRKLFVVLVVAGVVLFPVLLPFLPAPIYKRIISITNMNDTSTSTRFDIYKSVIPVLKDYWLSGMGLDNRVFVKLTPNYFQFTKHIPVHSHNVYLQVWLETGILGFLAFLGTMLRTLKRGAKSVLGREAAHVSPTLKNTIICGMAALAGAMVISVAEYVWFYPRVMLIFWTVFGLLTSALYLAGKRAPDSL